MNATDRIAVGLVLIGGGVWLDVAALPGAGLPAYGFGLAAFLTGMWRAGRAVAAARPAAGGDR